MSDLAPFVAAAIRDKVVQDLEDELRELREFYQRVSIANCEDNSAEKVVVFAKGNLWEGDCCAQRWPFNADLLRVPLSQESPLPLRDLGNLQILVAGYHRELFAYMTLFLKLRDASVSDDVSLLIWRRTSTVAIAIHIEGWPSSHRTTWMRRQNQGGQHGSTRDLLEEIPRLFPQATVSFDKIFLSWNEYMMERFPEPDRTRLKEQFESNMGDKKHTDNEELNQQAPALPEDITTTTRRGVLSRFFNMLRN